jgi:hypothetical protein
MVFREFNTPARRNQSMKISRDTFIRYSDFVKRNTCIDLHDWIAILFLGCLTIVFLWRVVLMGQVLLPADVIYTAEPWKSEIREIKESDLWSPNLTDQIWSFFPMGSYISEVWKKGGLFWDPYPLGGTPALAQGELFSNPLFHLLNTFLPVATTFSWMAVLGLFFGGLFTYLLLRELGAGQFGALVGSLAFAFNGYLIGWLALVIVSTTMVWLPLVFWSFLRAVHRQDWRWTLVGTVAFAIYILSGFILFAFYGAICFILFALYLNTSTWLQRRDKALAIKTISYAGLILGLGSLIAAPQLFLTIQLFLNSNRTAALGATSFLELKTHLVRLLAPAIYGNNIYQNTYEGRFNYTETSLYFGILPLLFIPASLFGKHKKIAWGLFGIGLVGLLAVYNITPFRQIITWIYPVFLNAFPGRIFYIVAFTWSVAAGLGADNLENDSLPNAPKYLSLLACLFCLSLLLFWAFSSRDVLLGSIIHTKSLFTALVWLSLSALCLGAFGFKLIGAKLCKTIIIVITVIDLFIIGINYNSAFDPEIVFPSTPSLNYLTDLSKQGSQPDRVLNVNSGLILIGDSAEIYRLQTVSGYTSWILKRFSEYTYLTGDRYQDSHHAYFIDCCDRLLNALNVRYVYTMPGELPSSLGLISLINRVNQAKIQTNLNDGIAITKLDVQGQSEPVLLQRPPTRITYELLIQKPAVFKTATYIDPATWDVSGDSVRFEIYITTDGETPEKPVFSHYLTHDKNLAEQTPYSVEINLSPYKGKKIGLTLVTTPATSGDSGSIKPGWINPRIESSSSLRQIYAGPNKIYENREAFPRAWIVHQVAQVPYGDIQAVKRRLKDSSFDLSKKAIIEVNIPKEDIIRYAPLISYPEENVVINLYSPERIQLLARLEKPGVMVLSDSIYPGWRVYVDGIRKPILTTNLMMRGVFLESGEHQVEFIFQPDLFYFGLVLSLTTLLGIIVALIKNRSWSQYFRQN